MERMKLESGGASLRLYLLGGFRAECHHKPVPDSAWRLTSARSLVKILAVDPHHRLHREQIETLLWPDFEPEAAYNNFRKALHVARHALEPDRPPKSHSSYLCLDDDIVTLCWGQVWIDADEFERLALEALGTTDATVSTAALAAYEGELLPEDRYAAWAEHRRERMTELHLRLLLQVAGDLARRGALADAMKRLQEILEDDPAQEEAHRQLMRLYVMTGNRHRALRQYKICCQALRQELDAGPADETRALYEDIACLSRGEGGTDLSEPTVLMPLPETLLRLSSRPIVGRESALALLVKEFERASTGAGSLLLLTGEAGVGKSRLVAELGREVRRHESLVLCGVSYEQEDSLPYGPIFEALDEFLVNLRESDQRTLQKDHRELAPLVPSLLAGSDTSSPQAATYDIEPARIYRRVARLLDRLSASRPLVLVLDNLHASHAATLQMLHFLARLAANRPWLLIGAYREMEVPSDSQLRYLPTAIVHEGVGRPVNITPLSRMDSDLLVESLLGGVASSEFLDLLYRLSRGNPLFLEQLVQMMQDEGALRFSGGVWQAPNEERAWVPQWVRVLVEARAERLGGDVPAVLGLAAVAGMEFSFAILLEASRMPEDALLDALDQAVEAGILTEGQEGYAFLHPLFRQALYERIGPTRRARWQTALAVAVDRSAPNARTPDHHYDRSRDHASLAFHHDGPTDHRRGAYADLAVPLPDASVSA